MEQETKVRCTVFSRVVGYLSPLSAWHAGKKQEFKDRKTYNMDMAIRRLDNDKPD